MSQANELLNPPKFVVARNKKEAEKSIHCFPSFRQSLYIQKEQISSSRMEDIQNI